MFGDILKLPKSSYNYGIHNEDEITQYSHLSFSTVALSTSFFPIKSDLSGNTVWPQASGFQKLA